MKPDDLISLLAAHTERASAIALRRDAKRAERQRLKSQKLGRELQRKMRNRRWHERVAKRRTFRVTHTNPRGVGGRFPLHVLPGWQMLLARMDPTAWYGQGDVAALVPELNPRSAPVWLAQRLLQLGLVERAAAGEYRAWESPRYLYRVAPAGQDLARVSRSVMEMVGEAGPIDFGPGGAD